MKTKILSKILFILIAIFLSAATSQAAYFSFSNSDLAFEIYTGNTYVKTATPYSYITYVGSSPYYYIHYPFRIYTYNQYYYFDPGWYYFDIGPTIAPDVVVTATTLIAPDILYYNYYQIYPNYYLSYAYYPSTYYYYNSSWIYYPNWVYVYGPVYYGAYYYPIQMQASLTGQTYHPQKMADCSMLAISGDNPQVYSGKKAKAFLFLSNNSPMDLDVHNVQIYVRNNYVNASNLKFDKYIAAGNYGLVEFEVDASSNLSSGVAPAEISVNGTFKDGTYCGSADTKTEFGISVYENTIYNTNDNGNKIKSYASKPLNGSTAYFVPNKYEENKTTKTGTTEKTFIANNNNPNYSEKKPEAETAFFANNTETIKTYYGETQPIAKNCNGISIVKQNFNVEKGSEKTAYFTFKNNESEDFKIDKIETIEHSQSVAIEVSRDSKTIFSGQEGLIKVRAMASKNSEAEEVTAYFLIKGHYNSGLNCTINSGQFIVKVLEEKKEDEKINIKVPETVELKKDSGFLTFEFSNTTPKEAKIIVNGNGIKVQNSEFLIGPNSSGMRTIALNGLSEKGAILYFQTKIDETILSEKYAKIVKTNETSEIQDLNKNTEAKAEKTFKETKTINAAPTGITSWLSTGLSTFISAQNIFWVLLLIGIVAIAIIWAKRNL